MSDIDWSKAPEGATHWGHKSGEWCAAFYDLSGTRPLVEGRDGWDSCGHHVDWPERRDSLTPRPVAWTGEGLPPVGTVCELHISNDNWQPCEVIAMDVQDGEPVSVVRYGGGYYGSAAKDVRPIRTPEQIEAELREREIDDLRQVIKQAHYALPNTDVAPAEKAKAYAAAIHAAGYRKQEQPK